MCCRYWNEESPELRAIVEEMNRSPLVWRWQQTCAVRAYGEMRPTDVVPVIAPNKSGARAVFPMKWGYSGKTLLMNARTETAASKPTFKDDWLKHRCIVPASWYYEWEHRLGNDGKKHTGEKYMIQPQDSTMTWLCGLYRIEDGLPHFVILTREPGEGIRFIHDRMPLILPENMINEWIRPDVKPENLLGEALTEMVFEKAG
ncbi:MAG: SOS response-associated peptidase family protein [Lachnospiraceae bacterium]|nr:SOS response-associated peptidase family protein [Lachnospiraceae bacterium]